MGRVVRCSTLLVVFIVFRTLLKFETIGPESVFCVCRLASIRCALRHLSDESRLYIKRGSSTWLLGG